MNRQSESPHSWRSAGRATAIGLATLAVLTAAALGYWVTAVPDLIPLPLPLTGLHATGIVAFLFLFLGLVRRPDIGLNLLLLFVYLNLSQVLVRYHQWPSLLQILAVALLAGAWLERDRRDLARVAGHPLTLLLAGHCLVVLLSTTVAWNRSLADARFIESLKSFALYLLIVLLGLSATRLRSGIWSMVGAGTLLAGLGLVQVTTGSFDQEFGGLARIKHAQIHGQVFEPRIAGPLGDPNYFAQILLILVPLVLALVWHEEKRWKRVIGVGAAALMVAGTVMTYSRGGAVALVCVLGFTFLTRKIPGRAFMVALLLGVCILTLMPSDFTDRLTTLEEILPSGDNPLHPDSSFEKRWLLMGAAWRMFLGHPLLGVGAGNYTVHFQDHAEEVGSDMRVYEDEAGPHFPHNLYLEVGAETGTVGLLVFLCVLGAAFFSQTQSRQLFLARGELGHAALMRGLSIALLGYLISSLFLHGTFQRYLWLLFALTAALSLFATEDRDPGEGSFSFREKDDS